MKKASKSDVVVVVGAGSVGQACSRRISAGKLVNSGLVGRNGFMDSQISTVQERLKESFDANTDMDLINQPLLMLAGSKADALHMTERALDNATDARNKDCFLSKAEAYPDMLEATGCGSGDRQTEQVLRRDFAVKERTHE